MIYRQMESIMFSNDFDNVTNDTGYAWFAGTDHILGIVNWQVNHYRFQNPNEFFQYISLVQKQLK